MILKSLRCTTPSIGTILSAASVGSSLLSCTFLQSSVTPRRNLRGHERNLLDSPRRSGRKLQGAPRARVQNRRSLPQATEKRESTRNGDPGYTFHGNRSRNQFPQTFDVCETTYDLQSYKLRWAPPPGHPGFSEASFHRVLSMIVVNRRIEFTS